MAKITGKEGLHFKGPALVYDSEEDMLSALERNEITKGVHSLPFAWIWTAVDSDLRQRVLSPCCHPHPPYARYGCVVTAWVRQPWCVTTQTHSSCIHESAAS